MKERSQAMPKLILMLSVGLIAWMGLSGWTHGAVGTTGSNVAQVDRTSEWACPSPTGTTGQFYDIPDLALSLTTTGGPVLLMVNFTFHGAVGASAYWLEPVIDGQQKSADRMSWQTGTDTEIDNAAYQRVYALPAGAHPVGLRMSCQNQITILRGWLTVYELPAVKK
jgi:hypothetical protein